MQKRRNTREALAFVQVAILLLLVCFAASGCPPHKVERTENEIAVDNLITEKVRESLTMSHVVKARNIAINTFQLKVTLTGQLDSEPERDAAIKIAEKVEVEKEGTKYKVKEVDATKLLAR